MKKIKAILKDGKSSGQQYRVTDENLVICNHHRRKIKIFFFLSIWCIPKQNKTKILNQSTNFYCR